MSKRKIAPPPPKAREPRTNFRITAAKVRIVTDGKIEVMERQAALRLAESQGLDLVEVSPDQDPPVCKIIDYGKWKYEQQKKKKEASKNQHTVQIKEIKLRPKIAGNDYDLKKRNTRAFLEEGNKVKVTLRFRGREMAHPDLGMKLMSKLSVELAEIAVVESQPRMDGRQIVMALGPKPGLRKKAPEKPAEKPASSKKEVEGAASEPSMAASAPVDGAGNQGE